MLNYETNIIKRHNSFKIIQGPESVQGSDEWLAFRNGKISASMAPTIMNMNPWKTRRELFYEIMLEKKQPKTLAMQQGNDIEPIARDWINRLLGREYQPVVIQSVDHPDFIASLDGYWQDENGKKHLLEIKAGKSSHKIALKGSIPGYYYPQLQHCMDLVGVDDITYLSFREGEAIILYCQREESFCERMFREEKEFLTRLIDCIPPEPGE